MLPFWLVLALALSTSEAANLCPNGWTFSTSNSYCYYISNNSMTWDQAGPFCSSIGGSMVYVSTYTESVFLKNLSSYNLLQPWIAARRNTTNGNFYDSKGYTIPKSYWATNEPGVNGDCASYRGLGASTGRQVTQCFSLQPALCKQQPALCPNQTQYGGAYTRSGNITSPGYPVQYYNNLDCIYTINSPNGTYITLQFNPFIVEDDYDWVFVYDGPNTTSKYLGEPYYYGRNSYESSSNVITFKFHTDSSGTDRGWLASWAAKPATPAIRVTGTNGTLQSGNYPENYDAYSEQLYYISVAYGFQINLTITDFNTETNYDVLQVYNASYISTSTLVANLSGSSVAPWNILSPSNYLTLKFTSDGYLQKKGWFANWFIQ
ncbi:unnamed protein product [Caenorhabditis angaria]|uniref:CUB domain-containing protein n=1 Tax=Caenorhabditis angaria TaxID=860376 RepID=A0A9P1IFS8_9PELO|nr:unnamed protein product [Caenorhabditis angaria]